MPPPSVAISAYVTPASRRRSSARRSPAKTTCVCASTKPGTTAPPRASMVTAFGVSDPSRDHSDSGPTKTIVPPCAAITECGFGRASAWRGPVRGAGPSQVRTSDALWMRKSAINAPKDSADLFGRHPGDRHALPPAALAADDVDGAAGKPERGGEEGDQLVVGGAFDRRGGEADEERAVALAGHFGLARPGYHVDIQGGLCHAVRAWRTRLSGSRESCS